MTIELGNWESAVRKSILIFGGCSVILCLFVNGGPLFIFVLGPFYLFFSLLGWYFIGVPCHWVISKYTNGHVLYYLAAVVVFASVLVFSVGGYIGGFFGTAALLQSLIFLFYLKKWNVKIFYILSTGSI